MVDVDGRVGQVRVVEVPLTVTFDAHDPARLVQFWAGVLRREVVEDAGGALLPGEDTQLSLRFVPSRAEKVGPNRMHLHLTSASPADQQQTVATALGLGARHLDVGQRADWTRPPGELDLAALMAAVAQAITHGTLMGPFPDSQWCPTCRADLDYDPRAVPC